jgi:hypothetical protein
MCTGEFTLVNTNSLSIQLLLDSNFRKKLIFISNSVEFEIKFQ